MLLRVTEILDYWQEPELIAWRVKVGNREANRIGRLAMKVGSRVDELIKIAELPKAKDSDEVKQCYKAWQAFCKDYGIMGFEVGKRFVIEEEQITGEPDLLLPEILLDVKCSSAIRKKNWLQVCKYNQVSNKPKVAILRLDSSLGYYEFKTNEDVGIEIPYGISVFDSLHTAYRFFNKGEATNGDSSEAEVSITDSKE